MDTEKYKYQQFDTFVDLSLDFKGPKNPKYSCAGKNILGTYFYHYDKQYIKKEQNFKDP